MREDIEKRREQRKIEDRMARKNMPAYVQKVINRHKRSIANLEADLKIFENKGLNVGDYAYHKDFGKCIILDIKPPMMSQREAGEMDAIISSLHGENRISYQDLIKPGPGLEVLFEENKAE